MNILNSTVIRRCGRSNGIWSTVQLQSARWRRRQHVRKPIWMGTAKSKLLRFPQWHPYSPGELPELQKLYNDYRHMTKSLIAYFKEEYSKVSETSHIAAAKQQAEEEEHIRLMEENRLENERVAAVRNARLAAEVTARHKKLLRGFALAEEVHKKEIEEAEAIVRQKQQLAKNCITPEMLDDAIEKALDNEVDYNFSVDLEGNIYKGRTQTQPSGEKFIEDTVPVLQTS